jgi:hypothetical protein
MIVLSVLGEKSIEEIGVIFPCAGCTVKINVYPAAAVSRERKSCSLPTLRTCTEPPEEVSQVKLL